MGAVRRFRNAPGALRRLGQGVRRLRAGVVAALLPELAVDCAADGIQRRFPCGVRQLGGRTLFVRLLKEKARLTLPFSLSTTRFLTLTVFLGIFASAFSSLTAALSALRTARSSSGRARSSSVKISLGERFAIFITS